MLDFTSALYLGLQHPSRSLRPWRVLTTGAPAALVEPDEARQIARALAELQGCEAATLATSTLHLAWDLFGLLAENPITIFMDSGAYPITRWGAQRAAMRGGIVRTFRHHDAGALERGLATMSRGRIPVVATDGFCPGCGRLAPLPRYLDLVQRFGGLLVTDDTQALGVLGEAPTVRMPFGKGGGGSLRWSGISGTDVLAFSSLAKGFGAPLAVLAGSRARVRNFEARSLTRVHCSPPSTALLRAAEHAILCNRLEGEARRGVLIELVRRFRRGARTVGATLGRGLFPVQTVHATHELSAAALHDRLAQLGTRTVLIRGEDGHPCVGFLLTHQHTSTEIDAAVSAIAEAQGPRKIQFNPMPNLTTSQETNHEKPTYDRVRPLQRRNGRCVRN